MMRIWTTTRMMTRTLKCFLPPTTREATNIASQDTTPASQDTTNASQDTTIESQGTTHASQDVDIVPRDRLITRRKVCLDIPNSSRLPQEEIHSKEAKVLQAKVHPKEGLQAKVYAQKVLHAKEGVQAKEVHPKEGLQEEESPQEYVFVV
jgi:hypothetical protein